MATASVSHVRRTFALIALVVVTEPLSATILLPFVYFMVREFKEVDDLHVGLWCGIISRPTGRQILVWSFLTLC